MGWTGFYGDLKHEQNRILGPFKQSGRFIDAKFTKYGRNMWVGIKIDPASGQERSIILLWIFKKAGEEWLYKDLDEAMGPCEMDCPKSLLDKTTGDGSRNSILWRQEVLKKKEFKKEICGLYEGAIVEVYGIKYQIFRKPGKRKLYGKRLDNGLSYQIRPGQVGRILGPSEHYFLEEEKHEQQPTTSIGGGG